MRVEPDGESLFGNRHWINDDFFLWNYFIKLKSFDKMVHEHQNFKSCILFARAHPRSSSEGHKCVGSCSASFKSRWIELLWFRKVFRISMRRICTPIYLHNIRKQVHNYTKNKLMSFLIVTNYINYNYYFLYSNINLSFSVLN